MLQPGIAKSKCETAVPLSTPENPRRIHVSKTIKALKRSVQLVLLSCVKCIHVRFEVHKVLDDAQALESLF